MQYDGRMKSLKLRRTVKRLRKHAPSLRDVLMLGIGALVVLGAMRLMHRQQEPANLPLAAGQVASVDIAWIPESVRRWDTLMNEMGRKYDIDPDLLAIIMTIESGGNPKAQSHVGARGLMQVTPPTAGDIAKKYLKQPRSDYDLFNPRTSVEFGAAYLALLRKEFGEPEQAPSWNSTVELVAAGYNGGPSAASAIDKGEGLENLETLSYSRDAFNMWRERKAATSPTYQRWLERGGGSLVDSAR